MVAPVITLTTDFGYADAYVAAMKAVILTISPQVRMVDVSHDIRPQNVEQAAFVLESICRYFPQGTIHVAVVDPSVGSDRRAIALFTPDAVFVGPDNGVLSAGLPDDVRPDETSEITLPEGFVAYSLENPDFHRRPVSRTFHGRDIFAPVAAHLSMDAKPQELGAPVECILAIPPWCAATQADGTLLARVAHIDRFGNVITSARLEQFGSEPIVVEVGGRPIRGLGGTYSGASELVALIGSGGFLEIALPGGNAALELGIDIGERVVLRPASGQA